MGKEKDAIDEIINYLKEEQKQLNILRDMIIEYESKRKKTICDKIKDFFYSRIYLKNKI